MSTALAERGAVVIDADAIVHDLQRPGQVVLADMVERFGDEILMPDGTLNRQAMADLAFSDEAVLTDLGEIVHPAVRDEMFRRVTEQVDTDNVVILDIPLLAESGWEGIAGSIVVDLDPDVAVRRLVEHRGFSEEDARARIARQATREERAADASFIIDNSGSLDDLAPQIEAAWEWIQSVAPDQGAGATGP